MLWRFSATLVVICFQRHSTWASSVKASDMEKIVLMRSDSWPNHAFVGTRRYAPSTWRVLVAARPST